MIDASSEETFPASDPSASAQPGSIAQQSYALARRRAGADWLVPVAVGIGALALVMAMRRRR